MSIKFSTTAPSEVSKDALLITIATRGSKGKDGKETKAAHKPYYGVVPIPEPIAAAEDEFVKLAALAGLSAAYQAVIRSKLPTKLLASAKGAEQEVSVTLDDLKARLASDAAESKRLTKEAITEAWKVVVAGAYLKLCQLKGVASESELDDKLRRQVGAQLETRCTFLLSLAATTGVFMRTEAELVAAAEWLTPLAEKEAETSSGWVFANCLDKIVRRLTQLAEEREKEPEEEEEAEIDLSDIL